MNTLSIKEKVMQDLMPAIFSGVLSLGAYSLVLGEPVFGNIPFFSTELPAAVVVGGTVFASHLAGNVLQDHVLKLVQTDKLAGMEGAIAKPIISGLSTYGIFKFGVSDTTEFIKAFAVGAGSVVGGDYISNNFMGLKKKF